MLDRPPSHRESQPDPLAAVPRAAARGLDDRRRPRWAARGLDMASP